MIFSLFFFAVLGISFGKIPYQYSSQQIYTANTFEELTEGSSPSEIKSAFDNFANSHYGAEIEPYGAYYDHFGCVFSINQTKESEYLHASLNSAVVGFETNLPANSKIEYGTTQKFEFSTPYTSRRFFVHVTHLNNLQQGTKYYFRYVAKDERGNILFGETKSFTTLIYNSTIHTLIPDDFSEGCPYKTAAPYGTKDKYYILTKDIVCNNGDAIIIYGGGNTIDLNGFTIHHGTTDDSQGDSHGIRVYISQESDENRNTLVVNGFVKQIENEYMKNFLKVQDDAFKYHNLRLGNQYPFSYDENKVDELLIEVAGIYFDFWVMEAWSVILRGPTRKVEFHHNVWEDRGNIINNRHYPASVVVGVALPSEAQKNFHVFHHNLIKRHRQKGITFGIVYNNEIYTDSWATNSFAIMPHDTDTQIYNNKLFLTGYHAIGIGFAKFNLDSHHNFFHMEGIYSAGRRSQEYDDDSVITYRITNYGGATGELGVRDNLHYHHDTVVGFSRSGGNGNMRGTQVFSDSHITNCRVENSKIYVDARNEETVHLSPSTTQGAFSPNASIYVEYNNLDLISNAANIRFGDSYSVGNNHRYTECTLVKSGNLTQYHTIKFDGRYVDQNGHELVDCVFANGAKYNDVIYKVGTRPGMESGLNSGYSVLYTKTIDVGTPNIPVTIKNGKKKVVFDGNSGLDGKITHLFKMASFCRQCGETNYNPFSLLFSNKQINITISPIEIDYPLFYERECQNVGPEENKNDDIARTIWSITIISIFGVLFFIIIVITIVLILFFVFYSKKKENKDDGTKETQLNSL